MAASKPKKRQAPSHRIPPPADGTVVRARLSDEQWFYAQTWRGVVIFYLWSGVEDLDIEEVVSLPVAFRIAGDTGHFWASEWKGRAEIVGVGAPSVAAYGPEEWAIPARGIISRWDGHTGFSRRNASLSEMHGLQLARPYFAADIIDRLSAALAGRDWEGLAYMDASQGHLDVGEKPQQTDKTTAPPPAFHPFELFPDAPDWVDSLGGFDDATLLENLLESLALDDGYVDRDEGGPAMLAATIIALANSHGLGRVLSPGRDLAALANRLDKEAVRRLLPPAREAVARVGSAQSDIGSALSRSEPALQFFAEIAAALR